MKQTVTHRCPHAKALASKLYKQRVVKSRKVYTRKGRNRVRGD